jgi:hypothetical protein
MKKLLLTTLVSATFVAAAAPVAFAQSASDQPAAQDQRFAHRGGEQRSTRLPSERVEARLAYLKTALKITDAQEAQWNTFADTLRSHAKASDERMKARRAQRAEGKQRAQLNAIERMERRQARMAQASQRLAERLAAVKPLYAALSPEQQQVADELFAQGNRRAGHHRGGRGRA